MLSAVQSGTVAIMKTQLDVVFLSDSTVMLSKQEKKENITEHFDIILLQIGCLMST